MSLMKHLFSAELSASAGKRRLSIAFLDTGISPVEDFILPENRIVAFRDLINGKREPYDDNGHGTHLPVRERENSSEFPVNNHFLFLFFVLFSDFHIVDEIIYQFMGQFQKGRILLHQFFHPFFC